MQNEPQLTENDIGKWFTYVDWNGKEERGKLKKYDNDMQTAWIVYKANDNWDGDHWKDYTSNGTNYSDLKELKKESHE